jgi:hypothetical protein
MSPRKRRVGIRAANTSTVLPASNPYHYRHHWDEARTKGGLASDEQMAELHKAIEAHEDTDRNIELLWEWAAPKERQADGTFVHGRPSAHEVEATIGFLKSRRRA